jgi:ADP-ribosylglycohydrolase
VVTAISAGRDLRIAELARTGADGGSGFVLDSLRLSVAAVLDRRPLPEVLVDVVRLGYDTDTNAAIAGGLLGIRDGATALPDRWVTRLQFAAEFSAAARVLAGRRA